MKRYVTDASHRFRESGVAVKPAPLAPEMNLVKVYPGVRFQQFIGFGAALTEAAGYVFAHMTPKQQEEFLQLCFSPERNGYSLCRLSIQSCDFSLAPRPYLDARDESLAGFSIDDDWGYVLPLVKAAQRVNPGLQFIAAPWSPPAWAKTNRSMKRGGHLRRDRFSLWARMMARALAEYRQVGVDIGRVTVQNEPNAIQAWESCLYNAAQERDFLVDHLKPVLREAGLGHVKTLVWDHNKEGMLDRAAAIMQDDRAAAAVDGVAFHWYSGDHFEALRATRDLVGPDRELIFTEGCDYYSAGDPAAELQHAEHYAHEIVGDLQAGANAILDWNILLNAQGGPNHVDNFCDAPIMYDMRERRMNVRLPFCYLGHFSRFVQVGAHRVLVSRFTDRLETCCFRNPDDSMALVVLNRTDDAMAFDLNWGSGVLGGRIAHLDSPAHSIQTICW